MIVLPHRGILFIDWINNDYFRLRRCLLNFLYALVGVKRMVREDTNHGGEGVIAPLFF